MRGNASDNRSVEAAEPELRRDDHQTEQQRHRVVVDGENRLVDGQPAGCEDDDGAKQRDAAAIERQAREFSQDHAGVDDDEDRDDEKVH